MNIFRAYDIRGNSKEALTGELAYRIGQAFALMNNLGKDSTVCTGRDGRLSSPQLQEALIEGLLVGGVGKIINIGLVPTPTLYFADHKFKADASIMVTGSHNPKDDNGFKMVLGQRPFFGEQIKKLSRHCEEADRTTRHSNYSDLEPLPGLLRYARNDDIVQEVDINEEYVDLILQWLNIIPDLKVVFDPGNGAAGNIIQLLAEKLPNKNIVINNAVDGNFPNHHPDPTVAKNLQQLINTVKSENYDIGIAFDGDADRLGVVSGSGEIISSDKIMAIFIEDILATNTGATIIADVKTSQSVFDLINSLTGNGVMCKTGHPYIKAKMRETGAIFGGEASGHLFFADKYYGYDDGIYAALRFLELLSRSGKTVDDIVQELPKAYNTPEIKIRISEEVKFSLIEQIKEHLRSAGTVFDDIDGVRVTTKEGWWLLRASNTEGAIIARCEGVSEKELEIIKAELGRVLERYSLELTNQLSGKDTFKMSTNEIIKLTRSLY